MSNYCWLIRDLNPRIKSKDRLGGKVKAQLEKPHNERTLTVGDKPRGSRGQREGDNLTDKYMGRHINM